MGAEALGDERAGSAGRRCGVAQDAARGWRLGTARLAEVGRLRHRECSRGTAPGGWPTDHRPNLSEGVEVPVEHATRGWVVARALTQQAVPVVLREWFSAW